MSTAELGIRQRRGTLALAGRETSSAERSASVSTASRAFLPELHPARAARDDGRRTGVRDSSTNLFQAKNEGYIEDILTSPLRSSQLALSYMSRGLLRGLVAALAVALVSLPFARESAQPATTAAALLLTGLVFSSLGVITGIWPTRSTSTPSSPTSSSPRSRSSAASSTPRAPSTSRGRR